MSHNYRCSDKDNCGKRVKLAHRIEWYIRRPKCPACGKDRLKIDPAVRRHNMARLCKCRGLHYPHRKGTVISRDEYCHSVPMIDVQARFDNEELGVTDSVVLKKDDKCPF